MASKHVSAAKKPVVKEIPKVINKKDLFVEDVSDIEMNQLLTCSHRNFSCSLLHQSDRSANIKTASSCLRRHS